MAELADAPDLGSGGTRREGSNPSSRTKADPSKEPKREGKKKLKEI